MTEEKAWSMWLMVLQVSWQPTSDNDDANDTTHRNTLQVTGRLCKSQCRPLKEVLKAVHTAAGSSMANYF